MLLPPSLSPAYPLSRGCSCCLEASGFVAPLASTAHPLCPAGVSPPVPQVRSRALAGTMARFRLENPGICA